jgi:unsaturated rhamnogalacturonyl hydrolase
MRLMSGTNCDLTRRDEPAQKMTSPFPSRVAHIAKLLRCGASPMLSVVLCAVFCSIARAQELPWPERVANSTMERVQSDAKISVTITGTVKAIGLDSARYHDGTYAYYVGSPVVGNDATDVGAFLPASMEMEPAPAATAAHGETVMVDAWFNSQQRQNAAGHKEYFHYKWNDHSDSGFSLLGHIFTSHGATLGTLYEAPTRDRLKDAQFYIIVSPDNPAKNPHPHYVQPRDADQVAEWVKQGGVLVLMENDPANADIAHLDLMADRFGIHFEEVLKRHVIGNQFAPGYIPASGGGPVFQHSHMLYMKDTCAILLKYPAKALLEDKAGIVMATAKYGKGTVVGIVDPWLYNEYTDHRNPQPRQDNYEAGKEFVSWLLKQAPDQGRAVSQP